MTIAQLQRLDAVHRRMLRNIVGRVGVEDEPWDETMRRMRARLAARQHLGEDWSRGVCQRRWDQAWHIAHNPISWPSKTTTWNLATFFDPAAQPSTARRPAEGCEGKQSWKASPGQGQADSTGVSQPTVPRRDVPGRPLREPRMPCPLMAPAHGRGRGKGHGELPRSTWQLQRPAPDPCRGRICR